MNLLKKDLLNLRIKKSSPNNLIYKYKTEGRSLKDFSKYQNPIDLFINLRDGSINSKEVLKNQINKKRKSKKKKKRKSNKCKIKCSKPFWFKRTNYWIFRDYSLLLSKDKSNAKFGRGLK